VNSAIRSEPVQPHLYICSRHPLALQILAKIMTAHAILKDQGDFNNRFIIAGNQHGCQILLLDTCSIEQWRDYAARWQSSGGRTIALVSCSLDRGSELHALHLGIHGVVPFSVNLERELPDAMRTVATGNLWMRQDLLAEYARRSFDATRTLAIASLTRREQQILRFIQEELSNKEIAIALEIAERTVKFHVSNILQKCQVKHRSSLLRSPRLSDSTSVAT
jgi:DNA-binding NarL/FixJ family response regulator